MPPKATDLASMKLLENVEKFGWHVMLITEEKDTPGWAFSVGLYHTFKHPEIVIFGLPKDGMHAFINVIGEDIRAGRVYRSDDADTELIPGYTTTFQTVEKIWYGPFLGYATWFYEGIDFPVLQCIWPDKKNKFPWDADYNPELLRLQPLLFHDEPKAARAEHFLVSVKNAEHHDHDWRPELDTGSHHKFKPGEWPFSDRVNFEVFTTIRVLEENHPILLVTHDETGDWQFLCGTTNKAEDARAVCFGCMFERDRTIGQLADLPRGWRAWRESATAPWQPQQDSTEA
jgi:Domain of unknown function (DUF4262)